MIAGVYKYVYEFLWGPMCPKGDIICEFVGTPVLPAKLAALIAKTEEVTGVHRYLHGFPLISLAAYIGYKKYKKKYGATDPLDLIQKIIEKEFGVGSIADKIFHTFVHDIEISVEAALADFKIKFASNTKGLSIEQQSRYRKERKQQIIEQTAAALPMHIQKNKADFGALAEQLIKLDKPASVLAIGEQAAIKEQANVRLQQLVHEIVCPEVGSVQKLKY